MVARREEEGAPEVSTLDDARALASDIKLRASRLRAIPGMLDGALEEVRSSLERVLREYDKMSHRRLGPFQRDLEAIAKRAEELKEAGRLSSRHRKLVGATLQHARRIHFWNARRALTNRDRAHAGRSRSGCAGRAEETLAKLHAVPVA